MRPDYGKLAELFPAGRPDVVVRPCGDGPIEVDWIDLLGWGVAPVPGERGCWAAYDPPSWRLTAVSLLSAEDTCQVHGVGGVAITVASYEPATGWQHPAGRMWARLTEADREWLAVYLPSSDPGQLVTFLDDGFDQDWGRWPRRAACDGWVKLVDDDLVRQHPDGLESGFYAGVEPVEIVIAGANHRCLRVIGVEDPKPVDGVITEHFVNAEGRQVYQRHWRSGREQTPGEPTLRFEGLEYVPWYDCLGARGWPAARAWVEGL